MAAVQRPEPPSSAQSGSGWSVPMIRRELAEYLHGHRCKPNQIRSIAIRGRCHAAPPLARDTCEPARADALTCWREGGRAGVRLSVGRATAHRPRRGAWHVVFCGCALSVGALLHLGHSVLPAYSRLSVGWSAQPSKGRLAITHASSCHAHAAADAQAGSALALGISRRLPETRQRTSFIGAFYCDHGRAGNARAEQRRCAQWYSRGAC